MPETDIKTYWLSAVIEEFLIRVLKSEHIIRKYYVYVRAVEVLWAARSALFLSPQPTCLDFYLPDLIPFLYCHFLIVFSKLFLNCLTQDTKR